MGLKEKLVESFAGKQIEKRVQEEVQKQRIVEVMIPTGERKEDESWRSLTQGKRDLTQVKQDRMIEIAFWLYDMNGMAHRIIEMVKDFVIGEGIQIQASNPNVRKLLLEFWHHSVNNMELKQDYKARELGIFGEQFYPVFVNEQNGFVQLGNIDPSRIKDLTLNPENAEEILEIQTKDNDDGGPGKVYKAIRLGRDSENFGRYIGDCFVFQINKVSTAKRGRSDLFSIADWLDGYERFLFNRLERSHLINTFLWDITLQGANKEQVKEFMEDQLLPRPASMRAHNDKVKWDSVTPDFKADDASGEAKLLRTHLLGQVGLPPHWFAGGEGITRATAVAMGTPVFAMLRSRQKIIRYMFTEILNYVIFQAVEHNRLSKDEDKSFDLIFPKLVEADFTEMATAISSLVNALVVATGEGYVSSETAQKAMVYLFSQLGIDISKNEKDKISEEQRQKIKEEREKFKEIRRALADNIRTKKKTDTED